MASGYTRQSAASIIDAATIQASHFNNEYNALETAFNGTNGHDHTGGTGLGPTLTPAAMTGLSSNGMATRTTSTTWAARTITGTAAEITVTNGDGVSGNPTLSLPNALTFTGKTVTGGIYSGITATITSGSITGITDLAVADGGTGASTAANARTNLGLVIGTDVQAYDADLAALASNSATGILVRTGAGTVAARTITGTANEITVTNGDGVSGAPTLSLPAALTFTGKTVTGGTFTGITDIAVADGGTGASTAADARANLGVAVELLDSTAISGATNVDYTTASWFDGTYKQIHFHFSNITVSSAGANLTGQYSADDGSTWISSAGAYGRSIIGAQGTGSAAAATIDNSTSWSLAPDISTTASEDNILIFKLITPPNAPAYHQIEAVIHYLRHNGGAPVANISSGTFQTRSSSNDIDGFRFSISAGTWSCAQVAIYGYK